MQRSGIEDMVQQRRYGHVFRKDVQNEQLFRFRALRGQRKRKIWENSEAGCGYGHARTTIKAG